MAGRDIVWNLIADSSKFASGTRAAAKAANDLFVSTRTNAERFALELGKLQSIQDKIDPDTFMRGYKALEAKYDPFGKQADINVRQNFLSMLDQDVIDTRLDKIAKRSKNAGHEVEAFGSKSMRANMAVQQLAFGLEDAASQYGTMGIAGAIRGASNNISAVAMMMGPQAAVFGALASTVAMLGAQYFTASQQADKMAQSQDRLAESANRLNRELDEREKNYALRFQIEDIGNMSAQAAADSRRKSARDAEILQIRKEGIELTAVQGMRNRARAEQARIEYQQKYEGFDQDRYNRNIELEKVWKMTAKELLNTSTDMLPTGLLNDNEIETLKKKQEEYRNLTVEIGNANMARKAAYDIEQRESKRAFEDKQSENQWNADQKDWNSMSKWIDSAKSPFEKHLEDRRELDRLAGKGMLSVEQWQRGMDLSKRNNFGDFRTNADKYLSQVYEIDKALELAPTDRMIAKKNAFQGVFGDLKKPAEKYAQEIEGIREMEKESAITSEQAARLRRKSFESTFGDLRTPMQKYREDMDDLTKLEREGALTAAESYKLRTRAASQITPQKILGAGYDLNTNEGVQAQGQAYEQALRQSLIASFAGIPGQKDQQQQIAANTSKTADGIEKLAQAFTKGGKMSLELVGIS